MDIFPHGLEGLSFVLHEYVRQQQAAKHVR